MRQNYQQKKKTYALHNTTYEGIGDSEGAAATHACVVNHDDDGGAAPRRKLTDGAKTFVHRVGAD